MQLLGILLVTSAIARAAQADELAVDRRSVHLDDTITIVLTLEGPFASTNQINMPLQNLELEGEPAVSTEFSWINGAVSNRKVLRYTARPRQAGAALVGPAVITGDGGQKETLAPVSLQVVPDEAAGSDDPLTILRELLATNRPPCFIIAEPNKRVVYEGEEVDVTWVLYNAANVQRWQVQGAPRLDAFWSEDLELPEGEPQQVFVGNMMMQRVPVRRVALFPLRSGTFTIGGIRADAAVLTRDDSPFGVFEGSIADIRVPSAPVAIEVRPLPPGPPVDLVGEVQLECSPLVQKAGGPVAFAVTLTGRANLRSAAAPRFDGAVDGETEVEPVGVSVDSRNPGMTMRRRWRYIVFPAHSGTLRLPPIAVNVFKPSAGVRQQVRCAAATLDVAAAPKTPPRSAAAAPPAAPALPGEERRHITVVAGAVAAILIAVAVVAIGTAGRAKKRRRLQAIVGDGQPVGIRQRLDDYVRAQGVEPAALQYEASDRGDAWRAVDSLLAALERDRFIETDARRDLRDRLRDLLAELD